MSGIKSNISLFFNSVLSIAKTIFKSNYKLRNKLNAAPHQRKLRILGNGKSLNANLTHFDSKDTDYMVVNRHILSESFGIIKPRYYVLVDPYFFSTTEGNQLLDKIKEVTTWKMDLYVPYRQNTSKQLSNKLSGNTHITLHYFNTTSVSGHESLRFYYYNKNLCVPSTQNVLSVGIYVGICQQYSDIELYGVEHSWLKYLSVNDNNEVCLENPHFFDTKKAEVKTWYEIQNEHKYLHEVLTAYSKMFEGYIELAKYAKTKNVNIYNCTKESFIDAFKRK